MLPQPTEGPKKVTAKGGVVPYFRYVRKTSGAQVFGCEAPNLEDADERYKSEIGFDPARQHHIDVRRYESEQALIYEILRS